MEISLSNLEVGEIAIVCFLQKGNNYYRQRLLALGLIPGVSFVIKRSAPLGDPIEIIFNDGNTISVRKKEVIIVKVIRTDYKLYESK